MRGITFNDKHSYTDFGLTVAQRQIGNPSKIKNKERVPYSNQFYDFSGIYGGQEYEERPLSYVFNVFDKHNLTKESFSTLKIAVLNWLMAPNNKIKLIDDAILGYYFLAEVESDPSVEEWEYDGTLSVEFTAYPFKISEREEGDDNWDEFNFLLDYSQTTEFEVSGTLEATLYNPGINTLKPVIKASAPMTIQKGSTTFNVPTGESESYDFMLSAGENPMKITGTGTVSFHFRKELI